MTSSNVITKTRACRSTMADLVRRFSWKTDAALRNQVLSAYHQIRKFTPLQKRSFYEDAETVFLSDAFLEKAYGDYVQSAKRELKEILYEAWKVEGEFARGGADELLQDEDFWARDVHHFAFVDGEYTQPAYRSLLEILDAETTEEFFATLRSFRKNTKAISRRERSVRDKRTTASASMAHGSC